MEVPGARVSTFIDVTHLFDPFQSRGIPAVSLVEGLEACRDWDEQWTLRAWFHYTGSGVRRKPQEL